MSLKGKVVAITRPAKDAEDLAELVRKHGGEPCIAPAVEVSSPKNKEALATFIKRFLDKPHNFVVFMSKNGVRNLFWTAKKNQLDEKLRNALSSSFIAAVGPTTAKELDKFGIKSHNTPKEYSSQGLLDFFRELNIRNKRICLFRADKVTNFLRDNLTALGASVEEVTTYQVSTPKQTRHIKKLIRNVLTDKIDIITFTSSAAVRNLFEIAEKQKLSDELRKALRNKTIAAIGPITAKTLQDFRVRVAVTPNEYTIESMMRALIAHLRSS